MGLFNRGFKPDLPEEGPPQSANGGMPTEDAMPPADPADQPELAPAEPAEPEPLPPETAEHELAAEAEHEPSPSAAEPAPAEPAEHEQPKATSAPPVNQAQPEPDDEGRISAHEALAPTRAAPKSSTDAV